MENLSFEEINERGYGVVLITTNGQYHVLKDVIQTPLIFCGDCVFSTSSLGGIMNFIISNVVCYNIVKDPNEAAKFIKSLATSSSASREKLDKLTEKLMQDMEDGEEWKNS